MGFIPVSLPPNIPGIQVTDTVNNFVSIADLPLVLFLSSPYHSIVFESMFFGEHFCERRAVFQPEGHTS